MARLFAAFLAFGLLLSPAAARAQASTFWTTCLVHEGNEYLITPAFEVSRRAMMNDWSDPKYYAPGERYVGVNPYYGYDFNGQMHDYEWPFTSREGRPFEDGGCVAARSLADITAFYAYYKGVWPQLDTVRIRDWRPNATYSAYIVNVHQWPL